MARSKKSKKHKLPIPGEIVNPGTNQESTAYAVLRDAEKAFTGALAAIQIIKSLL